MKREEFAQLVRELEARAEANPKAFLWNTAAMLVFGYAYLLCVFLLSLIAVAGLVLLVVRYPNGGTFKLGLVLGILFGGLCLSILRGVWVRLPAPEGIRVKKDQAPKLVAMIHEVRSRLRSQPFHSVVMTGDLNAAVVQVPRLGIFGWQRNFLVIGLPLLQALSPAEFKSVLAHEFGHLSANHSRFSGWIYRVRRAWEQVIESISRNQGRGSFALIPFF
jgi:Zn-dependent protease with chaperone function